MDHADITDREHLAALEVLRHAKNVFLCLAWIAVALHVFSWITAAYTDTLEPLRTSAVVPYGSESAGASEREFAIARQWESVLQSILTLGGFVGRSATLVLCGIFVMALLVSLSSGLGGAAGLAKACVWALVALALLVPWLRAPADLLGVTNAFYSYEELTRDAALARGAAGGVLAFVRYVLCPPLVGVFLLLAQLSFRRAHARITAGFTTKLPLHEV
jgi:hypothetical protein